MRFAVASILLGLTFLGRPSIADDEGTDRFFACKAYWQSGEEDHWDHLMFLKAIDDGRPYRRLESIRDVTLYLDGWANYENLRLDFIREGELVSEITEHGVREFVCNGCADRFRLRTWLADQHWGFKAGLAFKPFGWTPHRDMYVRCEEASNKLVEFSCSGTGEETSNQFKLDARFVFHRNGKSPIEMRDANFSVASSETPEEPGVISRRSIVVPNRFDGAAYQIKIEDTQFDFDKAVVQQNQRRPFPLQMKVKEKKEGEIVLTDSATLECLI